MIKSYIAMAACALAVNVSIGWYSPTYAQAVGDEFASGALTGAMALQGKCPGYTYQNMSIFLIHRKSPPKAQTIAKPSNFLTLKEALAQHQLVVNETGHVHQLTLQNFGNRPVFIQGGDIVKGGRQDRALQSDMILPAKSGLTTVNVFCVEHGRWSGRGAESSAQFSSSESALPSKELKLSANAYGNQSQVWENVSTIQGKAQNGVHQSVAASASPSSLQLTMENQALRDAAKKYEEKLKTIVDGQDDVVGYAIAINGQVTSCDVYGSPALFRKMWEKQLNASAIEAVSKRDERKKYEPVTISDLKANLDGANTAKAKRDQKVGQAKVLFYDAPGSVMLKTTDSDGNLYHRSYMTK